VGERPLLSVIIPVRDVATYLPGCLDSVLGPAAGDPGGGLEVIAVDDSSVDGSGATLDERAAADPRLQVVHLPDSRGPGGARNAGLARASGEYVWFVDADDRLAPGALAAVAAGLTAGPDILLIGWASSYPGGTTRPGHGARILAAVPEAGVTLAEQPAVIELSMTAWSKVLRREFLAKLGVEFGPGIHEDVPVTCAALLAAESVRAVTAICYHYRRERRGSFMATPGREHLAIFSAYARVFDLLDGSGHGPRVRSAVFERAIWHYATLFQAAGHRSLVPGPLRRTFFTRMHDEYAARRPPGYRRPPGARGVKFRLIERDAYRAYVTLEPVNRARLAIRPAPRRLR
jgi:CDP-glycerol glycerophosphotransferase